MRRMVIVLCMAALMVLPAAGVMAMADKNTMQAPAGMDKKLAQVEAQIEALDQQFLAQLDELNAAMEAAAGTVEYDILSEQLNSLVDEHSQEVAPLCDEERALMAKIEAWQVKHGISDGGDPPA